MSKKSRIQLLQSFAEQEPNNPFNWYGLALEHVSIDPLEAVDLFEKLLRDFPDYLPTYYHAANLYAELDRLENAKITFEKGIALARLQNESKTLQELTNSFSNFKFESDMD